MRGKRSKQYRKLMERYCMTFGFREPYQVLVDAEMVRDSCRFKMELGPALERTVHGKVKPMITQCEIRKLYASKNEPGVSEAIEVAKICERRRCGHHPDEYPEPLGTLECFQSVVDPKDSGSNKHRYVVASQSQDLRRLLRGVQGVPMVYIKRSVMILEPMSDESVQLRAREERSKFRLGIKPTTGKRKRGDGNGNDDMMGQIESDKGNEALDGAEDEIAMSSKRIKKRPGPKGPNPLSMKKAKKKPMDDQKAQSSKDGSAKRKRRRKNKSTVTQASSDAGEKDGGIAVESEG